MTDCTVSGNSAVEGGGISNQGTLIVANSDIVKNQATSAGGGISTTGGTATITNSTIKNNQVNSNGTALGGGIDSENSTLSLSNDTINANQANGARPPTAAASTPFKARWTSRRLRSTTITQMGPWMAGAEGFTAAAVS